MKCLQIYNFSRFPQCTCRLSKALRKRLFVAIDFPPFKIKWHGSFFTSNSHIAPGFGEHWAHSVHTQGTHCHHGCLLVACWIDGHCLGSLDYRVFMTLDNQPQLYQRPALWDSSEERPAHSEENGKAVNLTLRANIERKKVHLVCVVIYTGLMVRMNNG